MKTVILTLTVVLIGSSLGYFHGEWMKGIVDKKRKEKKMDQRIKDRKKRGEPSLMDQYLYKYGMKQIR